MVYSIISTLCAIFIVQFALNIPSYSKQDMNEIMKTGSEERLIKAIPFYMNSQNSRLILFFLVTIIMNFVTIYYAVLFYYSYSSMTNAMIFGFLVSYFLFWAVEVSACLVMATSHYLVRKHNYGKFLINEGNSTN